MLKIGLYTVCLFLISINSRAGEQENCKVAPLPDGVQKIEECRYKSPKNYTETLKFYKKLTGANQNYEFKKIIVRDDLRAIHIKNNNPSSRWEGINIYEHNKETRIFIIPRSETGRSSNGRTTDSGSVYLGSNPSLPAIFWPHRLVA